MVLIGCLVLCDKILFSVFFFFSEKQTIFRNCKILKDISYHEKNFRKFSGTR